MEERRRAYQRYKQDVEEHGKPFHPYAMFHDTVMSLVVVSVIVVLAVIWKFTAEEEPDASGWLGPLYTEEADPGTTNFIPRPDWYFFFLFYLLRIFKWPESVILGTVGIPTLALILLLALPFVDRRRERRLLRRPVALVAVVLTVLSMGVLTYKGATARESLGTELVQAVPQWMERQNLPEEARPGAVLFAEAGCLGCHTYLDSGTPNVGAPDLTDVGNRIQGVQSFIQIIRTGPGVMPAFTTFTPEQYRQLGTFLNASKGEQ